MLNINKVEVLARFDSQKRLGEKVLVSKKKKKELPVVPLLLPQTSRSFHTGMQWLQSDRHLNPAYHQC